MRKWCVLTAALCSGLTASGAAPEVAFEQEDAALAIRIGGQTVVEYVWADGAISRPYFCQVRTLDGTRVTRPHPPDPVVNRGNDDHARYHPGIWLAFGDLNGADDWRLDAPVRHAGFEGVPQGGPGQGRFVVRNRYETPDGRFLCEERCAYTVRAGDAGWLLTAESVFRPAGAELAFGDQEEMGFGIRLNTPLTVRFGGGAIVNSAGGRDEAGTWGQAAAWCAAYGEVGGRTVGALLAPAPDNFRRAWFHTRDYGLVVCNPFGRKAMTGPDDPAVAPDSTAVAPETDFALGFGVYVFGQSAGDEPDFVAMYEACRAAFEQQGS